jgi:hypothetical protein
VGQRYVACRLPQREIFYFEVEAMLLGPLTAEATQNPLCSETGTYRNVKLVGTELTDERTSEDWDAKWTESDVDPIDLKVFFWTIFLLRACTKCWNFALRPQSQPALQCIPPCIHVQSTLSLSAFICFSLSLSLSLSIRLRVTSVL